MRVPIRVELRKSVSIRAVAFAFVLFAMAAGIRADSVTISLASAGTAADSGQSNSDGNTIAIAPNVTWAAALPGSSWVSFGLTGDPSAPGFFVVPNGTVVSFFDTFTLPGVATGGTLTVMADDSAAVFLNGVSLIAEATSVGNAYNTCSNFGIEVAFRRLPSTCPHRFSLQAQTHWNSRLPSAPGVRSAWTMWPR